MNFVKTPFFSFVSSFKIFKGKELLELLYLSTVTFKQIFYNPPILFSYLLILMVLLFIKTNSILFLIVYWFSSFNCLAFLRPSVNLKNYKYFLSNLLVAIKLLSIFLLIFCVPYSVLHIESLSLNSLIIGSFLALIALFIPFHSSSLQSLGFCLFVFPFILLLIGFKGLIYHLLLMGYLNFESFLRWFLPIFMLDKHLLSLFGLAGFFTSPFMIFLALSAMDSRKSFFYQVKGLIRGLKLLALNYPLSFILFYLFKFPVICIYTFFTSTGLSNTLILAILFSLYYYFYLCFLTNIYVKAVHEQF